MRSQNSLRSVLRSKVQQLRSIWSKLSQDGRNLEIVLRSTSSYSDGINRDKRSLNLRQKSSQLYRASNRSRQRPSRIQVLQTATGPYSGFRS